MIRSRHFLMRPACLLSLVFLLVPQAWAQSAKTKKPPVTCASLSAELFASIRANPDNLVMRLEEALIIKESCAAELVTTAIAAVDAEPSLVLKIQQTAVGIAPARQAVILAAARHYKEPMVAAAIPVVVEEVRRAMLPEAPAVEARRGEEIRRAQLPDSMQTEHDTSSMNLMNVPKALPLRQQAGSPQHRTRH